jgi:amidophosphoribosyltransferase
VGQIVSVSWTDNTIGGIEQYVKNHSFTSFTTDSLTRYGMLSDLIQPRIVYTKQDVIGTFCSFEYIYFFRHNSTYSGRNVEQVRIDLGKQLALQCKSQSQSQSQSNLPNTNSDKMIVACVPQTSIASAKGFAAEMGLPFVENAIVKNVDINRTFILPNDTARQEACEQKFIFSCDLLSGKIVYLIDDSIVRGNTLKSVVKKLRACGVAQIHVRIPSPPIVSECYYGIDMSTKSELIAYKYSIDEMIKILDVDSLIFISIERMKLAFGNTENEKVCTSCFTGKYDDKLLDW